MNALRTVVPKALAAFALVLGLAACGDDDDASTEDATETSEATEGSETTEGSEDPTTTASEGVELPYDEMDAEMQGFASGYCEKATTWSPESSWGEGPPNALLAGQAGPDLDPFGPRIEDSSGPEEDAEIAADMAETCSAIGWSAE